MQATRRIANSMRAAAPAAPATINTGKVGVSAGGGVVSGGRAATQEGT